MCTLDRTPRARSLAKRVPLNGATSPGASVVTWDCNSGTNQQWNVDTNGTITSVQSGLCLDAYSAGTANGTKPIIWTCHGGTNQQWQLH
jgi:hypothetical protein